MAQNRHPTRKVVWGGYIRNPRFRTAYFTPGYEETEHPETYMVVLHYSRPYNADLRETKHSDIERAIRLCIMFASRIR